MSSPSAAVDPLAAVDPAAVRRLAEAMARLAAAWWRREHGAAAVRVQHTPEWPTLLAC